MNNKASNQFCILLLRGINVGGHNRLPMKDLKGALSDLGLEQVNHYIQSGNLVFSAPGKSTGELESDIENCISDRFSLTVPAMVLPAKVFKSAVEQFPFPGEEAENSVLVFLSGEGSEGWADRAKERIVDVERYHRKQNVAYMYCPNGLSRSKAAELLLSKPPAGIKATMRNWRTVNKILGMLPETAFQTEPATEPR